MTRLREQQAPGMYATVQDSSPLMVTSGDRPYVSLHTCMLQVISTCHRASR